MIPYTVLIALAALCVASAHADVTSTRVTEFDWRCEAVDGTPISNHQRFDTAFVACLNHAEGAFIQGGRYRITKAVVTAPTSSVALSWTPSTQNTDGTPATITGYTVHYGTNPSTLNDVSPMLSASTLVYEVAGLSPGAYYFAVRAYASGAQSEISNVASRTL